MVFNDNAKDVQPFWRCFQGKWAIIPVLSSMLFCVIYLWCSEHDWDFVSSIVIALIPAFFGTLYVLTMVNDKPKSHSIDSFQFWDFKVREWLYLKGCLDKPPVLWKVDKETGRL